MGILQKEFSQENVTSEPEVEVSKKKQEYLNLKQYLWHKINIG